MQESKIPSNVQEMPGRGETFQQYREKLNETWNGVNEYARDAASYADETVRNNPWTSVGVGFGVGVLVGALVGIIASSSRHRLY